MAGALRPPSPAVVATLVRAYMYELPTATRAALYAFAITYTSLVLATSGADTIFADVNNPVNQLLVKWAWGWTLALVALHQLVLARPSASWAPSRRALGQVARLAMGHLVWYLGARLAFPWVEEATGVCQATSFLTRRACRRAGFLWTGFDISGHCFLLTFCNLLIAEETRPRGVVEGREGAGDTAVAGEKVEQEVGVTRGLLCLLMVAWDTMILCTSLYFHTVGEKVLGWVVGVGAWHLLYKVLYPMVRTLST